MKLHPAFDVRDLHARHPSKFEDGTERGLEHGVRIMFRSAVDSFAMPHDPKLASDLKARTLRHKTPGYDALRQRGALIEDPLIWSNDMLVQSFDLARRAFQDVLGDTPEAIKSATLSQPVISLMGEGQVARRVAQLCDDSGIIAIDQEGSMEQSHAVILCADRWDHDLFLDTNAKLVDSGVPYLFAYVDQTRAVTGPLCHGPEAACYECHFERRASHGRAGRATEDWHVASEEAGLKSTHATPSVIVANAAATNAVALMIAHLSGMEHTAPLGIVREQELLSGTFEAGLVLKAPRCRVCGTRKNSAAAAPLRNGRLTWEAVERDTND